MIPDDLKWVSGRLEDCRKKAKDLQPWTDYFDSKAREFNTIFGFCNIGRVDTILEIGCGNGFTSVLLSGKARNVKAMDLSATDPKSHSLGISTARELVKRVGASNIDVVEGSAERIPFPDGHFDIVFSEYMLQYVHDKKKALSEMLRVLKTGGSVIAIMPNFQERVFVPLVKAEYIVSRLFSAFLKTAGQKNSFSASCSGGLRAQSNERKKTIISLLDEYISLRPDGAYRSYFEEMLRHRPSSWIKLFESSGLKVTRTFTTQLLPLGVFGILGDSAVRLIAKKTACLNSVLGSLPIIKNIGYTFGIVATKDA